MKLFNVTEKNRKWWILMAMTTSISMIFVDVTVLPVTLPTIERELNSPELALQWLINAYLLALTVFLLAGGRIGDMFGYRRVFCMGLIVFSTASALCGLAPSTEWFIAWRALQGIGGALLLPTTTAILFSSFPPKERGRALGIYVSIASIFLALGPFIGGSLTQYLSWRYVFWINLPIALIGLFLTWSFVPYFEKKKEKFDFVGFFTMGFGITSLIVSVMQAPVWGWKSPATISLLAFGLLLIGLLIVIDRKVEHPFIDFSIFRNSLFVGANLCILCTQFLLMVTVFWSIYFQTILLYTPATAGAIALIPNTPIFFIAPLAGYLTDRFGPKLPVMIGFSLVVFSLLWFNHALEAKSVWDLLPALIPFGTGVAMIFTPSSVSSLSQVPDNKRGIASGINNTVRQFGSTLGMAIIGATFLQSQTKQLQSLLEKNPATEGLQATQFEGLATKSVSAMETLQGVSLSAAEYIQASAVEAYKIAFAKINLLAAIIGVLGFICATFLLKKHYHAEKSS